jgi:hypothetical protein
VGGMTKPLGSTNGMRCSCGGGSTVIDSRSLTDGRRRRHRCKVCDTRFTTYEITAAEYDRLQSLAVDAKVVKAAIRALRVVEKAVTG